MQTLEQFLKRSDLALRCREVAPNPPPTTEPVQNHHYQCELHGSNGDRPVAAVMPSDNGSPDVRDVLDTLAAEAAVVEEAGGYERWALQMGHDPDSRYGERLYRAARRQAKLLRQLVGDEQYVRLLWHTERL